MAKAVSGFANSSGGLIVWGVVADKDKPEDPDCARELKPIPDLSRFLSRLESLTGEVVIPIVDGIKHKKILSESDDTGFAVTLVPESERGPHRIRTGKSPYYKRSGDSFYPMEHFDIADMFGRRKRPSLELRHMLKRQNKTQNGEIFEVTGYAIFGLYNAGRGIAKYPGLKIQVSSPYQIENDNINSEMLVCLRRVWLETDLRRQKAHYSGSANESILPETHINVCRVEYSFRTNAIPELKDMDIDYEIFADEMQAKRGRLVIPRKELISIME